MTLESSLASGSFEILWSERHGNTSNHIYMEKDANGYYMIMVAISHMDYE